LIPILLMLGYPGGHPGPDPVQGVQTRASDADRDTTVDILCAAVGDGRLTLDELEERAGAALSARTIAQLAALIADLPGRLSGRPTRSPEPAGSAGGRPRSGAGLRPGDPEPLAARPTPPPSRWALLQSLIDALAPTGSPGSPATVG
jgi:hypothetical protein